MNNNNRREFLKQSGLLLGGILLGSNRVFSRDSEALAGLEPYLGEIGIFAFNFAPKGWALCNGQLLPINQNQALFALLGTMYGGNGQTNFALPNLRGRVPMHVGNGYNLGQKSGLQAHTITISEMPAHRHAGETEANMKYGGTATQESPIGALPGISAVYSNRFATNADEMMELSVPTVQPNVAVGGNQAHLNMQPFLTLNFCIALVGIFPSIN